MKRQSYVQYKQLYVYILVHPKFDGWIKLGRTTDLRNRLASYQVCCPNREYKYVYSELLKTEIVQEIENYFKIHVHSHGWEWYECDIETAIRLINEVKCVYDELRGKSLQNHPN